MQVFDYGARLGVHQLLAFPQLPHDAVLLEGVVPMPPKEATFTAKQAAQAQTALRAALGLPPQDFPASAFIGMISDEIEQLRNAGYADESIANLVAENTGVNLGPETIAHYYARPEARAAARNSAGPWETTNS